ALLAVLAGLPVAARLPVAPRPAGRRQLLAGLPVRRRRPGGLLTLGAPASVTRLVGSGPAVGGTHARLLLTGCAVARIPACQVGGQGRRGSPAIHPWSGLAGI